MKNFIIITFIIAFIANNKTDAQCISNFPIFTTDPAVNNQQRNGPGKVNNRDWTKIFILTYSITQLQQK